MDTYRTGHKLPTGLGSGATPPPPPPPPHPEGPRGYFKYKCFALPRRIFSLLGLLALALLPPQSLAQTTTTYSSNDTPVNIQRGFDFNNFGPPADSNIIITDDRTISTISVSLDINYPVGSGLTIELRAPDGSNIILVADAFSRFMPTYTETSGLVALVGTRTAGMWRLRVRSQEPFRGMINSWSISVTSPGAAPTFGTETISPQQYATEGAITPLTLPAATGGDGTLSYSIVEPLPDGLSFDATTRILSGIPSAGTEQAASRYTYRAEDSDGDVAGLLFTIAIRPRVTFGSATIAPQNYSTGAPITLLTLPEASGGNPPLSYSIVEALPDGLTFDATTRTLSGTPEAGQPALTYTYRVTDTVNITADLTFTIEITDTPVAMDFTADLYRDPDVFTTPTVTIDFNDLIADGTTSDADLVVTLMDFTNPSVMLVSGGEIDAATDVLTLDSTKLLEVSSVAGTDLAPHTFRYTVTDEGRNTATANLTLRIDERPTLSYINTEFNVSGRFIMLGTEPSGGRELLTPTNSHTPHGEELRVVAVPNLANSNFRRRFDPVDGRTINVLYTFTPGFTGRVSGTFTVGLYATANSIANTIIPLMNADVVAGDLLISASATFTFIVPSAPPVLTPPVVANPYPPNQEIELRFSATDAENHALSFSLEAVTGSPRTLPANATFAPTEAQAPPATATFTWTPTGADAGTYRFNVVATETTTALNTAPATTRFQVMLVIASPLTFSGTTSGAVTENARTNTAGGTLMIEDLAGGDENFAVQNEVGTYGTFSINANGVWTYTLDNADDDTNALAESTTVTDVFTVAANARPSATQDVTITITGANDAPTATISAPLNNVEVGTSTVVTLTGTGSDPDTGDAITRYAWSASPAQGSFADASMADTTWTAPSGVGNVVLTLTVTDGNDATDSATITVRVVPVPVTITGDVIGAVTEDRGGFNRAMGDLNITTRATLSTFVPQTDVSGTYGTFSINADGMWTYDIDNSRAATQNLAEGAMADDVFTVVAAARNTATAIVTITVTGTNEQPTATISAPTNGATVNAGVPVPLTGTGTDVDTGDSTLLSYQWSTTSPTQGSFANATQSTTTWTPSDTAVDTDVTLTLTVTDASGAANDSATATVTVRVTEATLTISGDTAGAVTEDDDASNVASGALGITTPLADDTFAAQNEVGTYGTFTIATNGVWSYTLNDDDEDTNMLAEGAPTVTDVFTVTANARPSATQDVTITITGANDAPTATISAPPNNVEVGTSTVVTLTGANSSDPDTGDAITRYAWSASPAQGSFADASMADTTWTAPSGVGNVVLTLTVTDGNDATDSATITVRVVPVPVTITGDVIGAVTEDRGGFNRAMGDLNITTTAVLSTFVPQTNVSGTYGTFSINADGMWTYDIDNSRAATQNLAEGAMADDVFTVVAAARATATAIVTITVTGANEQPTASISAPTDGATVNAGVPVALTGIGTDVDTGDPASLSYQWSTTPPNQGSFANATLATTTWTPSDTAVGTDVTLTLTVTDTSGAANDTATATVTVRVTATTLTISGTATTGAVTEDDNANNTASGDLDIATTLADATFVPQTNLSGVYGFFSIDADGNWNYRLDNDDVDTQALASDATAPDVFTARASARPGVTQAVTLTITGANDAPTVTIDTPADDTATSVGNPVTLTATGADVDTGDEAGLRYQWSTTPPNRGSFGNATAANTTWTAPTTPGNVMLTVTVTDTSGAANDAATATVTLIIDTTMFLPDLSGNGDLQASDAQILYYLGLPPSPSRTRLLDSLGVSADMVDQVNARAENWQNQEPLSDLNGNGERDRQDAQILYYTARFGPLLEVSPTLLQAVLGDLARNPTAALNNARRLLNR